MQIVLCLPAGSLAVWDRQRLMSLALRHARLAVARCMRSADRLVRA